MKLFLIKSHELSNEPSAKNHILIFASNERSAIDNVISKNVFDIRSDNLIIREIDTNKTSTLDMSSGGLVFKTEERQYINGQPSNKKIKIWLKPANMVSTTIDVKKGLAIDEINNLVREKVQEMIDYDWREID